MIVKFASFKTKQQLFSVSNKLKGTPFSLSEDFSPSVRNARRSLPSFAKTQDKPFKLSFDKLLIWPKTYFYNNHTKTVSEMPRQDRLGSDSLNEYQPITATGNTGISVLYTNACSVLLKREELCSIISFCNANVILLIEAWLHTDIDD